MTTLLPAEVFLVDYADGKQGIPTRKCLEKFVILSLNSAVHYKYTTLLCSENWGGGAHPDLHFQRWGGGMPPVPTSLLRRWFSGVHIEIISRTQNGMGERSSW